MLRAQATLNFICAAYLVKNVTAHHWIEVNKKPLLLFQIKRQQNCINLVIGYKHSWIWKLLVFPLRSAYHILTTKMLKVVFYRSLYTIIYLFIQFFILQTNYRSAKSILCPNIILATKYRRQNPVNIYLLKHRFWLHIIKVQFFLSV